MHRDGRCIFVVGNEFFHIVFNVRCIMLIRNGWLDAAIVRSKYATTVNIATTNESLRTRSATNIDVRNEQPGIVNYEYVMSNQNPNNQLVVVILKILPFLPGTSHVDKRWCCASPICVFLKII